MLTLKPVEAAEKDILRNVFQKYYYEMSAYYDLEMNAGGNYDYRYFDAYFEEDTRTALFLREDDTLIGFVMLNDYSCLGDAIDHAVAEFTVFPRYRGRGLAAEAMRRVFRGYPGRWEIKYSERNRPAGAFWRKVTAQYKPRVTACGDHEAALSFSVQSF
ncbi:MAG: GNAT family N-acetyltransferase [Oscillospiraceae bacterium]|nr:GNAT family N-acetyltransferase [Oscillospiraceae bacterium]